MSSIDRNDRTIMPQRGFRLDKGNAKFMGVCGGIANFFGWDVNLVRIGFALGTVFGLGSLLIAYILIGLIAD
ncbi:MAG: PspC domain-containing protein [Novosphingobium sp.]